MYKDYDIGNEGHIKDEEKIIKEKELTSMAVNIEDEGDFITETMATFFAPVIEVEDDLVVDSVDGIGKEDSKEHQ